MRIQEFLWPQEQVDHIARHGVTPEEVEEVCFGRSLVLRAKSQGENPVYYVLGQTNAGRHLFCVVIHFPDGKGYPVTARPMTDKEKRRYRQWKSPMSKKNLPHTDSIQELARFWDTHDMTDFQDELEEVTEQVFDYERAITVRLPTDEAESVHKLATSKGVKDAELIREWVREKIGAN